LVVGVEYLFPVMLLKKIFFSINTLADLSLKKAAEVWHDFSQACVRREKECHIGLGIWKL
jgi:hypothetical protein